MSETKTLDEQLAAFEERMRRRREQEGQREEEERNRLVYDAAIHQAARGKNLGLIVPQRFATQAKPPPRRSPRPVQSGGRR